MSRKAHKVARFSKRVERSVRLASNIAKTDSTELVRKCIDKTVSRCMPGSVGTIALKQAWEQIQPVINALKGRVDAHQKSEPITQRLDPWMAKMLKRAAKSKELNASEIMEACVDRMLIEVTAEAIAQQIQVSDPSIPEHLLNFIINDPTYSRANRASQHANFAARSSAKIPKLQVLKK